MSLKELSESLNKLEAILKEGKSAVKDSALVRKRMLAMKKEAKAQPASQQKVSEEIELSPDQEKNAMEILASVLAVGLSQIEDLTGESFESVSEAEEFLKKAFVQLKGKYHSTLASSLRKFERMGSGKTKMVFRRSLANV